MTDHTTTPCLWTGGEHFGDWLGLDAPQGSYMVSSREDFYRFSILCTVDRTCGKGRACDSGKCRRHTRRFMKTSWRPSETLIRSTGHRRNILLAVQFGLAEDCQKTADALAQMIRDDGCQMRTGFVGNALYSACTEQLRTYGSCLYTVMQKRNIRPGCMPWEKVRQRSGNIGMASWKTGELWSTDMNSFNHYAIRLCGRLDL